MALPFPLAFDFLGPLRLRRWALAAGASKEVAGTEAGADAAAEPVFEPIGLTPLVEGGSFAAGSISFGAGVFARISITTSDVVDSTTTAGSVPTEGGGGGMGGRRLN